MGDNSIINNVPCALFITDMTARYNGYCFYSLADFHFFAPQGLHIAPIKVQTAKFHFDRIRDVGLRSQKLRKFGILPI